MKTILLILLFCLPLTAQTRDDLRKTYGTPTPVSESYQARPNILLTVSYGPEGQICYMSAKPNVSDLKFPEPTSESLQALIDELVPADKRGRNIINGFLSGAEIYGTTRDYENLKIYNAFNLENEKWVNVLWKDKGCNNFPEFRPFRFSRPPVLPNHNKEKNPNKAL